MKYFLNIAEPDKQPARFELAPGYYTIGRGDACKIRLRYPDISERHALLTLRDSGATIEDLHSSNGTQLNGITITNDVKLRADDVVGIGSCLLRVEQTLNDSVPPPVAEPIAPPPPAPPDPADAPETPAPPG